MLTRRTVLSCALSPLAACSLPIGSAAADAAPASSRTLAAYRDEAEMQQALGRWRREAEAHQPRLRRSSIADGAALSLAAPMPAAPAAAEKSADAAPAAESITNVQTAGVDEGGIVKRTGDFLIVLRRGRLFTVRIGGDALQPAACVDAFAPGTDGRGAWYDELLVSGSTVVVIGYSYERGGTEIGLFSLAGDDGALSYRATYHLRSFDYYSSRNYASRLIGRKLIFYTPTLWMPWGPAPEQMMPGVRRWQGPGTPPEFQRILPATRVYRSDDDFDPTQPLALHTVTQCELGDGEMRSESTAVLGPAGRVFYVSQGSVYVWTSTVRRLRGRDGPQSAVFRLPLDGAAPSALKTAGVPIDQMSFLEDRDGRLNVLLRDSGAGEGMWGSESRRGGALALLRVPLAAFGDGHGEARQEHYQRLPDAPPGALQNRFVGDWLLWGGNGGGSERGATSAWALRYADAAPPIALAPGHGVERIEALGRQALLVGNAGADLRFSCIGFTRTGAAVEGGYTQRGAEQGESRSHGFFYRPTGDDGGLLGLPVLGPGSAARPGVFAGARGSAAVLFLRHEGTAFSALGSLEARPERARDDACRASCVDWYGNARPLFIGERVFALMGYELVEGRLGGGVGRNRLDERRRIDFSPRATQLGGRYSPFN